MNKLICDLPEKDYFAIDAASNSTLSHMIPTPAHCYAWLQTPHKPTKAMIMGSAIHAYTLEGYPAFSARYAPLPEGLDKRTKAGKALMVELAADGRILLDHDQFKTIRATRESVLKNKIARNYFTEGTPEISMIWHDEYAGYECKGRMDCLYDDSVIVDLKTTDDASPSGFSRSVAKYGYHRQAAFYSDGYTMCTGKRPDRFIFVVVETKPPHAVGIYQLNDTSLEIARSEYRVLLKKYRQCVEEFLWPGFDEATVMIELPSWYMAHYN